MSTDDQHLDLQRDALAKAGCERVFEDTASGAKAERTGLTALLAILRQGDTVVIWRLDRLGRSLKGLIYLVERLDTAGVGLRSLQESIDTASIGGRLVFHLFGALAEFERNPSRAHPRRPVSRPRTRPQRWAQEAARSGPAAARLAALPRAPAHRRRNLPADGHRPLDPVQLSDRGGTQCPADGVRRFRPTR